MLHVKLGCGIMGTEEALRPFFRTDTLFYEAPLGLRWPQSSESADGGQLPRMEGRLGICGP